MGNVIALLMVVMLSGCNTMSTYSFQPDPNGNGIYVELVEL